MLILVLAAVYRSAAIGETLPAILAGFMLAIIAVMNVNIAAPIKINGEKDTFVPTSEFAEYIIFKKYGTMPKETTAPSNRPIGIPIQEIFATCL